MRPRIASFALLLTIAAACDGGATTPQAVQSTSPYDGCVRPGQGTIVTMTASDGQRIKGALLGTGTAGVVLGHQGNRNLCSWLEFAGDLAGRGYQALAIDFRGYGGSTLRGGATKQTASDKDIGAAVGELRRRGATKIVIIGASLGAIGGVVAAADIQPLVQGVVQISGPRSCCGLDAGSANALLRVPILFVVTKGDAEVYEPIKQMYEETGSKEKKLVEYDGIDHGTGILDGANGDKLRAELIAFVTKYAPAA